MKGAGKGVTRDGAIRDGASEEITRGTHLMTVYPAFFFFPFFLVFLFVFLFLLGPRLNTEDFCHWLMQLALL